MPAAAETIEIVTAEPSPAAAAAETISLDPWSARYGVETASLAPFAGEPPAGEPSAAEIVCRGAVCRQSRRRSRPPKPSARRPAVASAEPEAMPIAEAEEGVPFVSQSERELEAAEAAEHAAPHWGEPARTGIAMEPEHAVETGSGGPETTAAAEARPLAEPERTEAPPGEPAAGNLGNGESARPDATPEPAWAASGRHRTRSGRVPAPRTAPAEPTLAESEPMPTELTAAPARVRRKTCWSSPRNRPTRAEAGGSA